MERLQALFCSPCTVVIARRAGDGSCRLVLSQGNGGMYPWGNQGQPPLPVQSDTIVQAAEARGTQLSSCNSDNHANDGQRESSAAHEAMANHQSVQYSRVSELLCVETIISFLLYWF